VLDAGLREARTPQTLVKKQTMSFLGQLCRHKRVRPFRRISGKDRILQTENECQTLRSPLWRSFNGCLFPHFLWELVFALAWRKPEILEESLLELRGPRG